MNRAISAIVNFRQSKEITPELIGPKRGWSAHYRLSEMSDDIDFLEVLNQLCGIQEQGLRYRV